MAAALCALGALLALIVPSSVLLFRFCLILLRSEVILRLYAELPKVYYTGRILIIAGTWFGAPLMSWWQRRWQQHKELQVGC